MDFLLFNQGYCNFLVYYTMLHFGLLKTDNSDYFIYMKSLSYLFPSLIKHNSRWIWKAVTALLVRPEIGEILAVNKKGNLMKL